MRVDSVLGTWDTTASELHATHAGLDQSSRSVTASALPPVANIGKTTGTWESGSGDLGAHIVPTTPHNFGKTPPDASSSVYHDIPRVQTAERQLLYYNRFSSQLTQLPRLDDQTLTDQRIWNEHSLPQLAVTSQSLVHSAGASPSATRLPQFDMGFGSSSTPAQDIDTATTTAFLPSQPPSSQSIATATVPVTGGKQTPRALSYGDANAIPVVSHPDNPTSCPWSMPPEVPPLASTLPGSSQEHFDMGDTQIRRVTHIDRQPPAQTALLHTTAVAHRTARPDNNHINSIGANPAITTNPAFPQNKATRNPATLRSHRPGCPLDSTAKMISVNYNICQVISYLKACLNPKQAAVRMVLTLELCTEHANCLGIWDGHHIIVAPDMIGMLEDSRQTSTLHSVNCSRVRTVGSNNMSIEWRCSNSLGAFIKSSALKAYRSN